jgi:hypothetical protein
MTATGEWISDRTHGRRLKARLLKTSAPTTVEGIERYLGSHMIRGIGPERRNVGHLSWTHTVTVGSLFPIDIRPETDRRS